MMQEHPMPCLKRRTNFSITPKLNFPIMTKEKQIQVIHGCANGVSVSQKILFMEYSGVLLGVCKRYIRDHSEAKDVLQDSFLRIFKFAHKYDHESGSLLGWMKTICIRIALQKIKGQLLLRN
jgi:hypothetical protein